MASGHVNRIQGRTHGCTDQCCKREESSCQLGAVHTLRARLGGSDPSLRRPLRNWLRRLPDMSIEARVEELQRRHSALEMEIAEAHAHPSIDDLEIVSLKRRKLLVKDELVRLKN